MKVTTWPEMEVHLEITKGLRIISFVIYDAPFSGMVHKILRQIR